MSLTFDIAGRVHLTVEGADADAERSITRHMDPCVPTDAGSHSAGLRVECGVATAEPRELINPARDGVTTAAAAGGHLLVRSGGNVVLPRHDGPQLVAQVGDGATVSSVIRTVIRPALQIALVDAQAVAIHSACVELDGGAIAVAGWSESGKTEIALGLMELGGRFISDKWTVVGDDVSAGTFPIGVGVRRWVLGSLPTLRAALPGRAKARMRGARVMDIVTSPLRHLGGGALGSRVGATVERGVMVADRVALSPSEVAAVYGHPMDAAATSPLRTVVMLSTIPTGGDLQIDEVDAQWAARRLATTAQYERREYFDLIERARYADASAAGSLRAEIEQREREFLTRVLAGVRILRVQVPFPADPRPVAAAIAERAAK